MEPMTLFTDDYVKGHAANWMRWTGHLQETPCRVLEVGAYEGRSAHWWLDNVCTNPGSELVIVEPGMLKIRHARLLHNLGHHPKVGQVKLIQELSRVALPRLESGSFDLIYVDGSHEGMDVMLDGLEAFRLCKTGGVIIFDDYGMGEHNKPAHVRVPPRSAINMLHDLIGPFIEVESNDGWQACWWKMRDRKIVH